MLNFRNCDDDDDMKYLFCLAIGLSTFPVFFSGPISVFILNFNCFSNKFNSSGSTYNLKLCNVS